MRTILPAASRGHLLAAKALGATMWCWILWRLKHDWKDLVVCMHGASFKNTAKHVLREWWMCACVVLISNVAPSIASVVHWVASVAL